MASAPDFTPMPPPFSVAQLAERWGCSSGAVRKLIDAGQLHTFRIGVLIRISSAEVERFECQTARARIPFNGSGEDMPSSSGTPPTVESQSGRVVHSSPEIGPRPKRKRERGGKAGTVLHGPWSGS